MRPGEDDAFASGQQFGATPRVSPCCCRRARGVLCAGSGLVQANSPGKPQPGSSMKPAIAYKPLAFADVPGWDQDDHAAAFKAFLKSCERVVATARERAAADKAPPPRPRPSLRHAPPRAELPAPVDKAAAKAFFERYFIANAVSHSGPRGLLTGYYEPLVQGSRTPQGAFQTADLQAPGGPREPRRRDAARIRRHGAQPRPQDRQGHRAVSHPRPDRPGRLEGPQPRAALSRRSGRSVLPAGAGIGARQAYRTGASYASSTTARTGTPIPRSAAT